MSTCAHSAIRRDHRSVAEGVEVGGQRRESDLVEDSEREDGRFPNRPNRAARLVELQDDMHFSSMRWFGCPRQGATAPEKGSRRRGGMAGREPKKDDPSKKGSTGKPQSCVFFRFAYIELMGR